jgi:hypothetical protein
MTTPNTNTPYLIINDAMHDAGLLQEGDTANGEQYSTYVRTLQDVINFLQVKPSLKLWLQTDQSIPLVAGKGGAGNPYTMTPGGDINIAKPLRIQQGYFLDVSGVRRPIYPLSWDEWLRLSQITQLGAISQYFVDKQQGSLNVYFWLIPDAVNATGTAHVLLQQQVTNPINLTDTMDFPIEWRLGLRWSMADEICTGQPQSIMDRCKERAQYYQKVLEDWDVEDAATSFTPDMRQGSGYGTGGFR